MEGISNLFNSTLLQKNGNPQWYVFTLHMAVPVYYVPTAVPAFSRPTRDGHVMGPFFFTQPNLTHQLMDPTQPSHTWLTWNADTSTVEPIFFTGPLFHNYVSSQTGMLIPGKSHFRDESCKSRVSIETLDFARVRTCLLYTSPSPRD